MFILIRSTDVTNVHGPKHVDCAALLAPCFASALSMSEYYLRTYVGFKFHIE